MAKIKFRERNPVVVAVIAIVVVGGLMFGSLQLANVPFISGDQYVAYFAESGGLSDGDPVKIAGTEVGKVVSTELDGAAVRVEFTAKDVSLGDRSNAAIKTQTLLGARFLAVTSEGDGVMEAGDEIPLERTRPPYSVTDGLSDLTRRTGKIDTRSVAKAMHAFSGAIRDTPDEIRQTLSGVTRLSETISSRDQALSQLFSTAKNVTGVLRDRTRQLTLLLGSGNTLLQELETRRAAIESLVTNADALARQIRGLVSEHAQLRPTLEVLNQVVDMLRKNQSNIVSAVDRVSGFITGLGEGVASGPWFQGHIDAAVPVVPTHELIPKIPLPKKPDGVKIPQLPSIGDVAGLNGGR